MYTNYVIFYGNLCYILNTDSEHLCILSELPLAITRLKHAAFILGR